MVIVSIPSVCSVSEMLYFFLSFWVERVSRAAAQRQQKKKKKKKKDELDEVIQLPIEVLNVLLFLEQFCKYAHIPRDALHGYIPAYIFDAVQV